MCGIFCTVGTNPTAAQRTLEGLKTLEYRGYDSWGVAFADLRSQVEVYKQVGKIGKATLPAIPDNTIAIGHTRWATHGGVTVENAHPHTDCSGRFAIVHNGIVENYQELKTELTAAGHTFTSTTDSETIAHLVEELSKTESIDQAVLHTAKRLRGLNAIIVLDAKTQRLYAVCQGSPLVVAKNDQGYQLASDAVAFTDPLTQVLYLSPGYMVELSLDFCRLSSIETNAEEPLAWQPLPKLNASTQLGPHPHYLIKEIHEQPGLVRTLAGSESTPYAFSSSGRVFLIGCGTAYHAALLATYWFAQTGKLASAYSGSEFFSIRHVVTNQDTVIFYSQSGETIDVVEHARYLAEKKISTIAITNNAHSSLARIVHTVIPLDAGTEQSVLATKSFTLMLAHTLRLLHPMETLKSDFLAAANTMDALVSVPALEQTIAPVANLIKSTQHLFVIGRGVWYPLALEAALKIKEVTYIHAEGFAGGELKHGAIALISTGTPCLVYVPNDDSREIILSNAMELKARGAVLIGISSTNEEMFDFHIPVAWTNQAAPLTAIVPMQLLAYQLAILLGRDPDKPRNLAKSVTVR